MKKSQLKEIIKGVLKENKEFVNTYEIRIISEYGISLSDVKKALEDFDPSILKVDVEKVN